MNAPPDLNLFRPRNVGALLACLLVAAFYPVLLGGQTFCYRDFGVMAIPTAWQHRMAFWSGEFPHWNPYSNCGVPFFAQWGTMVLYPPTLLYVLLPMPWSLNLFCLLHLWIGGLGVFFLARRWVGNHWGSALAAVGFTFNGITQAALSWPNYTAALGLLPWVVLSAERAWLVERSRKEAARATVLAAFVAGMQLMTGVPELTVFTWLVVGWLWMHRMWLDRGRWREIAVRQLVLLGCAVALCAIQLLPFYQLLSLSQRTPGFAIEKWSLPIWGWANFILPRFHTFTTPESTVFQYGQEFLSSTYLGAPLLILSFFALRQRSARVWIFLGLSLAASVLALGSAAFVYTAVVKAFPFLGIARYPVKFLFLVCFFVPLLAAWGLRVLDDLPVTSARKWIGIASTIGVIIMGGLMWINFAYPFQYDRWMEFKANSLARVFFLILFAVILLFLKAGAYQRYSDLLKLASIVVLALDLSFHLRMQNPMTSSTIFEPYLWVASQSVAKPDHGTGRAFITPEGEAKLLRSNISDIQHDLIGKRLALWSHLNLLDRVPKVNGSATLQLRGQAEVQKSLYSGTNQAVVRWLDFLNATIQTSTKAVIEWDVRSTAMPFITAGQKPVPPATDFITSPIDFGREVSIDPWLTEFERFGSTSVTLSDITFLNSEITFVAETVQPALAVLPMSWHPAWKVTIAPEGRSSHAGRVFKANHAFQAIQLPAGRSAVRLYYNDRHFYLGFVISVGTLAVGALAWFQKEKRPSQT